MCCAVCVIMTICISLNQWNVKVNYNYNYNRMWLYGLMCMYLCMICVCIHECTRMYVCVFLNFFGDIYTL